LWVAVIGSLGGAPGDYELVVVKNAVDAEVVPFHVADSGLLASVATSGGLLVASGDQLELRLRPASGGARAPSWQDFSVKIVQSATAFLFDLVMPASVYCNDRLL